MNKTVEKISSPDDLNKFLKHTSPATWIILGLSICLLLGLIISAFFVRITDKIQGIANVKDGEVTLVISESNKRKLEEGQKVYILDQIGVIDSVTNYVPVISGFDLDDGEYNYTINVKEIRPIDFLIK